MFVLLFLVVWAQAAPLTFVPAGTQSQALTSSFSRVVGADSDLLVSGVKEPVVITIGKGESVVVKSIQCDTTSATLKVSGALVVSSPSVISSATVEAGGTISGTFEIIGTLRVDGGILNAVVQVRPGGTLSVQGGRLENVRVRVAAGATLLIGPSGVVVDAMTNFNVKGHAVLSASEDGAAFVADVVFEGDVVVEGPGTVTLAASTHFGSSSIVRVQSGTSLRLRETVTISDGATFEVGGTLVVDGATINLPRTLNIDGAVEVFGATLAGPRDTSGFLRLRSATTLSAAAVTVDHAHVVFEGRARAASGANVSLRGGATVVVNPTGTLDVAGPSLVAGSYPSAVSVAGALVLHGPARYSFEVPLAVAGAFGVRAGATVRLAANSTAEQGAKLAIDPASTIQQRTSSGVSARIVSVETCDAVTSMEIRNDALAPLSTASLATASNSRPSKVRLVCEPAVVAAGETATCALHPLDPAGDSLLLLDASVDDLLAFVQFGQPNLHHSGRATFLGLWDGPEHFVATGAAFIRSESGQWEPRKDCARRMPLSSITSNKATQDSSSEAVSSGFRWALGIVVALAAVLLGWRATRRTTNRGSIVYPPTIIDEASQLPMPRPEPLIGNMRLISPDKAMQSMMRMAQHYGPIFRFRIAGRSIIMVSSQELVSEVCDEKRFDKRVHTVLKFIRDFAGDGLFTAFTEEANWTRAHRVLVPAFGPLPIRGMFPQMLDIAEQMLMRWVRFGASTDIDVGDHMTRLTLDTIALTAFGYRFNSFYQDQPHPFVNAMVHALEGSGVRARTPAFLHKLMLRFNRQMDADTRLMHDVSNTIIEERRRDPHGVEKQDLLHRMLHGRDPSTNEGLSDENIRYQMITFLIAGHETTSGLLTFALYLLLTNPQALTRTRAVVDEVLGHDAIRPDHLPRLRWVEQVLMESLRLWPTAPAFGVYPLEDTVVGGKYRVTKDDTLLVNVPMLHRDPKVWGEDFEAFRPDRFDPERDARLPPHSWKPFGNGQRACIGRPFAMQEAVIVLAMVLQRFDISFANAGYVLDIKETLTLKPHDLRIRATLRGGAEAIPWASCPGATPAASAAQPLRTPRIVPSSTAPLAELRQPSSQSLKSSPLATPLATPRTPATKEVPPTPLLVLYGSNTGSAEGFAQRIGSEASGLGYAPTVAPLDKHAGNLPTAGGVIIVTASYEGQPPDNARKFVAALEAADKNTFAGVKYAVFGVGNRQWARTYQAVPIKVDSLLENAGATRLKPRGESDASGDFFGPFDEWLGALWVEIAPVFGRDADAALAAPEERLQVEFVTEGRSTILRAGDLAAGVLLESNELVNMSSPGAKSKRYFEIGLPAGMTYRTGDYLALLPRNPDANVARVLRRFGLAADAHIIIHRAAGALTSLPTEYPVSVGELLANYVELSKVASAGNVKALAGLAGTAADRAALEVLAREDVYAGEVLRKNASVLDLLERHPTVDVAFAAYLEMLPPLQARQYSISSSPLWNAERCALTVALVDAPALSGTGRFLGVASNYLAGAAPGTRMAVSVRPTNQRFHPPADPRVPMIMICAGTGIAPFRGFVQERALQHVAGQEVGRALLFFGCDHPDVDYLYRDELETWEAQGVVSLRPSFSHAPVGDVKYVQHRLWADRADVEALFRAGATVFVCGDGLRMAPAVRETLVRMYRACTGAGEIDADAWAERVEREQGRFVADVFA